VIVAQEETPKAAHTEATDAAVAATCQTTGLSEGKHCSECNAVLIAQMEIPKLLHSGGTATCKEGAKCGHCGEVYTDPLTTHMYGDWTVSLQPTNKSEGEQERTCSVCGNSETVPIPMLESNNMKTVVIVAVIAAATLVLGLLIGVLAKRKGTRSV
jgi:hypothetical protein